ncbi:Major Facilitator Superfamily protein [Desulfitobacterium chlororespirans DSM 11544]|uniref:Major Facilitator Superfamily protein n=1 Tax=Desulfitobacterium chlororespirans DSM 11544 TaxID=1121395 RepID=A0A1M7S0R5_9FIRM|nr:Major Facilitator Superfamily protein [Desulfitobacterium chlororespirans DSM 11544]
MNEPQKKLHYGWLIILGCMIMVLCCVGLALNVFSIFVTPLAEELELTKTQVSTVMSMISVGSTLILMFSGRIYQRYSTRKAMFIFGLCVAGGFLLFAVQNIAAVLCRRVAGGHRFRRRRPGSCHPLDYPLVQHQERTRYQSQRYGVRDREYDFPSYRGLLD